MKIVDPIAFLNKIGFHKYNAKSSGESLLIHSYNLTFAVIKPTAFLAISIPPFKPVQITIEDVRAVLRDKVNASAAASYRLTFGSASNQGRQTSPSVLRSYR